MMHYIIYTYVYVYIYIYMDHLTFHMTYHHPPSSACRRSHVAPAGVLQLRLVFLKLLVMTRSGRLQFSFQPGRLARRPIFWWEMIDMIGKWWENDGQMMRFLLLLLVRTCTIRKSWNNGNCHPKHLQTQSWGAQQTWFTWKTTVSTKQILIKSGSNC